MTVQRIVLAVAGTLILLTVGLSMTVSPNRDETSLVWRR